MSQNLSKNSLKEVLQFYQTKKEESVTETQTEFLKKLPKTKQGLKKIKHQLKYQHSQSNVQLRKREKGEEETLLDKLKQKKLKESEQFKKNLENLKLNKKRSSKKLQEYRDEILNSKVNHPTKPITKFSKKKDDFLF